MKKMKKKNLKKKIHPKKLLRLCRMKKETSGFSPRSPTSSSSSFSSCCSSPYSDTGSPVDVKYESPQKRKREDVDSPYESKAFKKEKDSEAFQIPWNKALLKKSSEEGLAEFNQMLKKVKIPVKEVVQCPVCHHLLHSATKSDVRDHVNNLHLRCLLANCCGTDFYTKKKLEEHKKSKKHKRSNQF